MQKTKITVRKIAGDYLQRAERASDLLLSLIKLNNDLDPSDWVSAMMSLVAHYSKQGGFTHDDFADAMRKSIKAYKSLWEDNG